jgi:hypothetical protein
MQNTTSDSDKIEDVPVGGCIGCIVIAVLGCAGLAVFLKLGVMVIKWIIF